MSITSPKRTKFQTDKIKRDALIYKEFTETEGARTEIAKILAKKHSISFNYVFWIIREQRNKQRAA